MQKKKYYKLHVKKNKKKIIFKIHIKGIKNAEKHNILVYNISFKFFRTNFFIFVYFI